MNLATMDLALRSAFLAEASILLILLAGAILLYWSFRERYLVPWIAGWSAYSLAKLSSVLSAAPATTRLWLPLAYASFVVAVGLFTCAVFLYVQEKKLLGVAVIFLSLAFVLAIVKGLWLPESALVRRAFGYFSWRLVVIFAAARLFRFAWGRLNVGRWLLAVMLLFLHPDLAQSPHALGGMDVLLDLLLGISMMTIVLDDSRVQIQRLHVLNTVTQQASNSTQFEPMTHTVLERLIKITSAKAAWFRIIEGDRLTLVASRGLSAAFTEAARTIEINRSVGGYAMREREVCIVLSAESTPDLRQVLKSEGIHHLVLVPVEGKSSRIGILVLGLAHFRAHTREEKDFLKAAAKQLGLAAENSKLVQQVVQSRSEWASTFDSIPDYILVHDPDYRILRANRALLNRLGSSHDDVGGKLCEATLPGAGTRWKACPYCAGAQGAVREDTCFGGFSVISTSDSTREDGTRGATVHVIKDITEIKAAEERYTSLFSHMHE